MQTLQGSMEAAVALGEAWRRGEVDTVSPKALNISGTKKIPEFLPAGQRKQEAVRWGDLKQGRQETGQRHIHFQWS